jgi:hypothetical protein
MNKIKVFEVANEVLGIVSQKTPSPFIPFKGKFPLLSPALEEEYGNEISSGKNLDEVPLWVQDVINKALKIKRIDDGFVEYLKYNGIFNNFNKMSNSDKATELMRFLNANSMSFEYLNID